VTSGPHSEPTARALRLAHRGDHRGALENSLQAMAAAVAIAGLDGVEFDVRAAADGTPVLLHDPTLHRTHGRGERPEDLGVEALQAIGVPSLAAVLDAIPIDRFLDVELKSDVAAAAAPLLVDRATRGGRVVASSFDARVLRSLAAVAPSVERWLNVDRLGPEAIAEASELRCTVVSAGHRSVDAPSIHAARARGLAVAAWTVTAVAELRRLDALGVVAVCVEGAAVERGEPA
jgi:glycerophosphoryl diester phosphodiesterase